MKRVPRTSAVYRMSKSNPVAMMVKPGETFTVEAQDCYSGNLKGPGDRFTKEMWPTVNPATGPIYVNGAMPGDILRVEIQKITTADHAVMCVERGAGALADRIEGIETTILPIRDGKLFVRENLALPMRPMIGVIGVAPDDGAIPTGTPGEHGGNMDCKEVVQGSAVHLPVYVEGALLALGDIHALMGDGEVCICGAETSGEVVLRCTLLKSRLPTPCIETIDQILFVASSLKLDECEKLVVDKAHRYLTSNLRLKANEAARIMSLVGELRVCQVVDPLKTMKFLLPKAVLNSLAV